MEVENLKEMTLEELLELQKKIGCKKFSEKLTNKEIKKDSEPEIAEKDTEPEIAEKDRPLEVPMVRHRVARKRKFEDTQTIKKNKCRDPRFDDLSGKLDMVAWKKNYSFLADNREKERKALMKAGAEASAEEAADIKITLKNMAAQERAQKNLQKMYDLKQTEKTNAIRDLRQGRKPHFQNKRVFSEALREEKEKDLKKGKKYDKYVQKKEEKLLLKEKRKNPNLKIF